MRKTRFRWTLSSIDVSSDIDFIVSLKDKLSQLLQDHATLQTSAESSILKLERVTLQLEGARTKNTELERFIDEVKRSNAELQRQLEKWQTLDAKGNGELEAIRKQKIELEVKLSSLQDRSQRQVTEKEKELERMAKRDEKMKDLVQQWQVKQKYLGRPARTNCLIAWSRRGEICKGEDGESFSRSPHAYQATWDGVEDDEWCKFQL